MKTVVAALLLVISATASGQVLKCVRPDGSVEYASTCPTGTEAKQTGIKITPANSAPAQATAPKSLAEQNAEFQKRQAEQEEARTKAQKDAAQTAQMQRACNDARAYLAALQARNRVVRTDPKTGERVFLDDAGYEREIAQAQASVTANCK